MRAGAAVHRADRGRIRSAACLSLLTEEKTIHEVECRIRVTLRRQTMHRLFKPREGDRLHAVMLFGSEARGAAGPDGVIDVTAVTQTQSGDYGDEPEWGLAAMYPGARWLRRRVSVQPLTRAEHEHGDSPLLREARRPAVAA